MVTGYYLEDHPNPNFGQFGWLRHKVSGVIGVHTTESGVDFEGADAGAENTAAFIARRTDPGGYHILADWDSIIPLVNPRWAAWADIMNNVHAMSVSGAMNAARWRDLPPERAAQIVRNMGRAAAILVKDALAKGLLDVPVPARRITADEAIRGTKAGFYGHGETNPGTRYDPGTNFDWDLFLASYAAAMDGDLTSELEGFLMSLSAEDQAHIRHTLVSDEGRQELAQKIADVLLATTLQMEDGGTPVVKELLAVLNTRINHIKGTTDLLPALDADLRGEADIVRAHNATLLATVVALSNDAPNVTTEDVLARIDEAMEKFTKSHTLTATITRGEG